MQEGFEDIYRDLLHRYLNACRGSDSLRADLLLQLIEALRREYPDDADEYENKFG